MRTRIRARLSDESGYTLIELLVVMILLGILVAIALAVFLNQEDKAADAEAKSNVNNLARLVQQCNSGRQSGEDYTDCDTEAEELGETGLPMGSDPPDESTSCDAPVPGGATVTPPGTVRVLRAHRDCFLVLGVSDSGNRFWYVKRVDGSVKRDCATHGVNGCPADGEWAG